MLRRAPVSLQVIALLMFHSGAVASQTGVNSESWVEMLASTSAQRAAAVSNMAPSLSGPSAASTQDGGILELSVTASDPNPGDMIIVTPSGLPEGFSATTPTSGPSPLTVTVSGRVPFGTSAAGPLDIVWTAEDGVNAPIAATTEVSVAPTPDPGLPPSTSYAPGHVLVWFRPGIITQAPVDAKGTPDQFSYSSQQPALTIASAGISNMRRLLPWFDHSSIYTNDVNGNPITLPEDLTDLYIADIADSNVVAAVAVLETDPTSIRTVAPDYLAYSSSGPGELAEQAGASYVSTDLAASLSTTTIPDDLFFGSQWWLQNTGQFTGGVPGPDIRATLAWDRTTGGSGSTQVAVLSTGIDSSHPDLPFVALGPNFAPGGTSEDNGNFSSGTAGAGVIGARGNNSIGVAGASWGPGLVAVKIRDANDQGEVSWALQGVDWARANFMPIVYFPYRFLFNEDFIAATFKNAHATGMFIATGTGNDDNSQIYWPAGLTNLAEGVGAIQEDGLRWRNATDRFCPNPDGFGSPFGLHVKLCAPGGNRIVTTERVAAGSYYRAIGNCAYGWQSGTAGAAAAVSGTAVNGHAKLVHCGL